MRDGRHDVVQAVIEWVKWGRAPNYLIASQIDGQGKVIAQRPWCSYPQVAHWDGIGSRSLAESYQCQ